MITDRDEIARAASILAESDRTRYLTPHLHQEMVSELRWPGDAAAHLQTSKSNGGAKGRKGAFGNDPELACGAAETRELLSTKHG